MKKIIVTGVSGQTGASMLKFLMENTNHQVIGTIRRTSQIIDSNFSEYLDNPRFKVSHLDLDDPHSIISLVKEEKPDIIFNFGGRAFVPDSWNSPEATIKTNTIGVIHFLEAIRQYHPECRFMNACSSEIFGKVLEVPQNETTPPNPRSVYGVSKNAARETIKVYRDSYNIFACSAISFNHEGELRQKHYVTRKITSNVARILKEIKAGEIPTPLELGNLDAQRDWSHASDFVAGMYQMMLQDSPADYVFSSGEMHTIREFVELAFKAAGIKGYWVRFSDFDPLSEQFLTDKQECLVKINPQFFRPCEVDELCGDSTKAREKLGWLPKISFHDLVDRMIKSDILELENGKI
jgi:GDPmannose 4,6-dehydratase